MFASRHRNTRIAEYSMIVEPRAEGAVIGYFADEPISESVVDTFGRHFSYVGLACRRRDGLIDVTQLKAGEFVAEPGLVYRLITSNLGSAVAARHAA
jgi:hypothetical protein